MLASSPCKVCSYQIMISLILKTLVCCLSKFMCIEEIILSNNVQMLTSVLLVLYSTCLINMYILKDITYIYIY